MEKRKKISLILALAALAGLTWYLGRILSPQQLQGALNGLGFWAPAAYMALFAVLPAFFFPVAVLALAGGLLFGLWRGAAYTFLGAMLNCSLMFWMARLLGRERIGRLLGSRQNPRWQRLLEGREGFLFLVILRLIPAVPYNLINYTFGLTGMTWRAYILASAIGIIPGTFAFINIGDKALDVSSPDFWMAIGGLLALLVVTTILGKVLFKENEHEKQA